MARIHLFEFGDLSWFPRLLHDDMRAYLHRAEQMLDFSPFAEKLAGLIEKTGQAHIVDMGSGGTGPVLDILPLLREKQPDVAVSMTDLYPSAFGMAKVKAIGLDSVTYESRPVDATSPPANLQGVRTMFEAFHHFRPPTAKQILASARNDRMPIAIFEVTPRKLPTLLSTVLIPLFVLLLTPTIRPLTWHQLLFTYVIPILPLLIWWDGLVSHLRVYSADELRALVSDLESPDYEWDIGEIRLKGMPVGVPYLTGSPKD